MACAPARAQVQQAWVATYDGESQGDSNSDAVTALKVDRFGRVHVTGVSYGTNGTQDIVTIQYSAAGQPLWVASYDGGPGQDHPNAMVLDEAGNIYITGASDLAGTAPDLITLKYDSGGNLLWAARYNGPGNSSDVGDAIHVDSAGNVYVTGYSYGSVQHFDAVTIKYNPQGTQLWVARYDGPAHDEDRGQSLVVDAEGNVYVAGFTTVECFIDQSNDRVCFWNGLTIKYSPSGQQLWVNVFDEPAAYATFRVIVLDPFGHPIVTGSNLSGAAAGSVVTVKFTPQGQKVWVARESETGSFRGGGWDVATDSGGNVFVLAVGAQTFKYNPHGRLLWSAQFRGIGSDIALDREGNAYVTGVTVTDTGSNTTDLTVVKYDSCGNVLWNFTHDGGPGTSDGSSALDLDAVGNVYVGGHTVGNLGVSLDFLTLKLRQTDAPLPPIVRIRATRAVTAETRGWHSVPGLFTVTRDGDTNAAVTVRYTISGTASNSVDYTAIADQVVIPAGRRSVNISIRPIDDTRMERTEFVRLELAPDPAYRLCTNRKATVFILDNDWSRFWYW